MGAQRITDTWKIHPLFAGAKAQNTIDAGDRVYYLASNNLFCYYKDTQENEALNKSNYLSDVAVTGAYYDEARKMVIVTYDNGNMDVVNGDGKVTNMVDIKNATLSASKGINHISFDSKYAYAATKFGYVVIDDSKHIVKESRIYGKNLSSVAHVGKWIVIAQDGVIMVGEEAKHRETLDQYAATGISRANVQLTPIDDTHFFMASNTALELCEIDAAGTVTAQVVEPSRTVQVLKTKTGYIASCPDAKKYITTNAAGSEVQSHEAPLGDLVTAGNDGTVWGLNKNGLHKMGDENNYFKPTSIGIEGITFWSVYNPGDKKLYLSSTCDNVVLSSAIPDAKTEIWTYDGDDWDDVTPDGVPPYSGQQGNYCPVMVPGSTSEYLFSTSRVGICHVKDGKMANVYHMDNMPRGSKYMAAIGFDEAGNFYAVQSSSTNNCPVMILPKAKLANPAAVTKEDWLTPTVNGVKTKAESFKRSNLVISKKSNIKVFTAGEYMGPLVIWNDGGNIKTTTPATKIFAATELVDQDGLKYEWSYIRCFSADIDGTIWMGTTSGLVKFDPAEAFKSGFHVTRFKVPRNDGTNLADYLLDGMEINCITTDASGRKWIGTNSNGLFLVSANGTEILKSFNIDNSPLVSNTIYSVSCNSDNNSVYIVTSNGVMEYFTDVVPASPDYSNVHVFPNPVRPEDGTLVTIAGLMENSLVKIADSAGNVVKQLKSEGGMCTWDCCNDGGNRVSTGVYFVIASQNEGGNGSSVVSKFVVIK